MVSAFTTARSLDKPAAGDEIGTWGTLSVNPNMDIIDAGMGQTTTISGAAGSVVLGTAQFRCAQITFNSTLLASITVTFPTSFTGPYTIYHACTGSSQFTITLATTAAGGQAICCKPGEMFDVFNDGTNLRFRNLGHIGSYWDYAASSAPNWVSGCTVPPYLNCDGTVFSSATYPILAAIMGNTLPDLRGRNRSYLNQGTGRLTSSAGVDGNTNFASGGTQTTTISSANLPNTALGNETHEHFHVNQDSPTNPANTPTSTNYVSQTGNQGANDFSYSLLCTATVANAGRTNPVAPGLTFGTATPSAISNVQPTAIGGITLIRAA